MYHPTAVEEMSIPQLQEHIDLNSHILDPIDNQENTGL